MALHRYFCGHLENGDCELSSAESRHAASVMRVRAGDAIELFDGRGAVAEATVVRVVRTSISAKVTTLRPPVPPPRPSLALYVAVPKGPRQHVLVEKCTELGVNLIQPLTTARSAVRPAASVVSRWRRYAIEAGKQSRRAWLPEIPPPLAFRESVKAEADRYRGALRLIAAAHPGASPVADTLGAGAASGGLTSTAIWIGPEGGFTPDELEAARAAGLAPVSLGEAVLRVETAAIAVASAVRLGCPSAAPPLTIDGVRG